MLLQVILSPLVEVSDKAIEVGMTFYLILAFLNFFFF